MYWTYFKEHPDLYVHYTCNSLFFFLFFFSQNTAVLSSAILITLVGMMLHIHFVKVDHESLLVIGSLGIQVSSIYASGREVTTFIEMNKIKDIVINEAIYMVCKHTYDRVSYFVFTDTLTEAKCFYFSIRLSTTCVCWWRTSQNLMECQVWCHCFRWVWFSIATLHCIIKSPYFSKKPVTIHIIIYRNLFWWTSNLKKKFIFFFIFQSSKPRLNCLVKVYKSCQEILLKCQWPTS